MAEDFSKNHNFGGEHTAIKLGILEQYLRAYSKALRNQPYELIYIDAFAGCGFYTPRLAGQAPLPGSAQIALKSDAFHRYYFVENNAKRAEALQKLKRKYPSLDIEIYNEDANTRLPMILRKFNWRNSRGVLFLDPYGMEVNWETLVAVAKTKGIDVWYLFSLSGLYRNVPHEVTKLDEYKKNALQRCLGTTEWFDKCYVPAKQMDLFNTDPIERTDLDGLENFALERLSSLFPKVLKPIRLPKHGAPLFSLFFAMSNTSPQAIRLATKIAGHILNHT